MELYNFFTEVVSENEPERLEELKASYEMLLEKLDGEGFCELVLFTGLSGEKRYSIIGQVYGSDTNVGDTGYLWVLDPIKYTWFDASYPEINNINQKKESDLDKLRKTFKEIGCDFEERNLKDKQIEGSVEYNAKLLLDNGVGYKSMWMSFYFLDGKFVNHGAWE